MKKLRGFIFGVGCVGTIFCLAVGLFGFRHSDPASWSLIQNAEIQKSYVVNRIVSRTMPAKWAPVIDASYEFTGKRILGTVELGSHESKSDAETALASHIENWKGQLFIYKPEPTRASLSPISQDYFVRVILYGIPFYLLLISSVIVMFKKKNEPNQ